MHTRLLLLSCLWAVLSCEKLQVAIGSPCIKSAILAYSELAAEMVSRGHEVSFLIPDPCKLNFDLPGTRIPTGTGPPSEEIGKLFSGGNVGMWTALTDLMPALFANHTTMFEPALYTLNGLKAKGRTILTGHPFATGVLTAADKANIPVVLDAPAFTGFPHMSLEGGWHFPSPLTPHSFNNANFFVRLKNFFGGALVAPYIFGHVLKAANAQRVEQDLPPLSGIMDTSRHAVMLRSAAPFAQRSVPPNVFLVGAQPTTRVNQEITGDLLKWIKEGPLVVCSFGSVIKLGPEQAQKWAETFGKLKHRVLWAFGGNLAGVKLPKNVRVEAWLPQNAVLQHPNTKGFITHGGYNSVIESIFAEQPMIVIPMATDGPANAASIEDLGCGKWIQSIEDVSALNAALTEMVDKKAARFKENLRKLKAQLAFPGGIPRMADILEQLASVDDMSQFVNPVHTLAVWEAHAVDTILAIFFVPPCLLLWLLGVCCCKAKKKGAKAKPKANKKD